MASYVSMCFGLHVLCLLIDSICNSSKYEQGCTSGLDSVCNSSIYEQPTILLRNIVRFSFQFVYILIGLSLSISYLPPGCRTE